MIIEYSESERKYDFAKAKAIFKEFRFDSYGISIADLEETLLNATEYVKPYIGKFAKNDFIKNIVLGVCFALFLCGSVAVGMALESYVAAAGVMIFYILGCFAAFWVVRILSHK